MRIHVMTAHPAPMSVISIPLQKSNVVIFYHHRREINIVYFCLKASIFFNGGVLRTFRRATIGCMRGEQSVKEQHVSSRIK